MPVARWAAGRVKFSDLLNANTYKAFARIDTANRARTGLFVPEQDTLFVGVPHRGSQEAEIRAYHVE